MAYSVRKLLERGVCQFDCDMFNAGDMSVALRSYQIIKKNLVEKPCLFNDCSLGISNQNDYFRRKSEPNSPKLGATSLNPQIELSSFL